MCIRDRCEEIALIGGGQVIARDTAAGLRERYAAASLTEVYMKTVGAGRLRDPRQGVGNGASPRAPAAQARR